MDLELPDPIDSTSPRRQARVKEVQIDDSLRLLEGIDYVSLTKGLTSAAEQLGLTEDFNEPLGLTDEEDDYVEKSQYMAKPLGFEPGVSRLLSEPSRPPQPERNRPQPEPNQELAAATPFNEQTIYIYHGIYNLNDFLELATIMYEK